MDMLGKEQTDHDLLDDDENEHEDADLDFPNDDENDEELQAEIRAFRAASVNPGPPQAKPQAKSEPCRPPFGGVPTLDASMGTEMLLNNMLAECHGVMRHLAIPLAAEAPDPYSCRQFLSEAVSLVRAGAAIGKTVAMLRAADRYAEAGTFEQMDKVFPAIEKNG
jgi:hypothetical protein